MYPHALPCCQHSMPSMPESAIMVDYLDQIDCVKPMVTACQVDCRR